MFIIINNWNLFSKYSLILLYYPIEYLFEIEMYDKRTTIKRWKISSRFSHHSLLFSNLAAVSFIRNFFLETLLWIHRFTSCIISWGKEDITRPVCVPLLSEIPCSPSERKKEKETWWCDHLMSWNARPPSIEMLLETYPLLTPVHAIFQKESRSFLESDPSNNTNTHIHLTG